MNRFFTIAPIAVMITLGATAPGFAQVRKASFDAGAVIPVKLDRELNSKTNRTGDKFTAKVVADKDGYSGLPEGAIIEGVLREARAKEGEQPGLLDLSFQRVRLANGRAYAITGSVIGLDDKSVEKNSEGVLVAKSKSKNNRLTYVGYGAGAGLLASVLGGGKIRLENVILGAGLGYLAGSLEKNRKQPNDVTLKEGTNLGVRLDRALSLTSYNGQGNGGKPQISPPRRGNALDRSRDGKNNETDASNPGNSKASNADNIGVLVNDKDVSFSSSAMPMVSNGIVMVPVRPVADSLGATLRSMNSNQTVEATYRSNRVRIGMKSAIAVVNGTRRVRLAGTAKTINGTTYVPATFFDLLTGSKNGFDSGSRTLIIDTKGK
ncbi:MAG: copper amine oxidase N-terminal domain-containing protein [Chthonomonadaceae bacterium]|nr:copper amine oxidase N-terminal domain-containing protein [Chthonomonadaceae bacterium]